MVGPPLRERRVPLESASKLCRGSQRVGNRGPSCLRNVELVEDPDTRVDDPSQVCLDGDEAEVVGKKPNGLEETELV